MSRPCLRAPWWMSGALLTLALAFPATPALALSHTFTSTTTLGASDFQYDGYDITVLNCTLFLQGGHTFHSVTLTGGTMSPSVAADSTGLSLGVQADMTVDASSHVFADGLGFASDTGPSAGVGSSLSGGGGGHAGHGGDALGAALTGGVCGDAVTFPLLMGSGGGHGFLGAGGAGGGYIKLVVTGTLRIDGELSARGATAPTTTSGGGAGGTVFVSVGTLAGSGTVSVRGGDASGSGGAGGGGCIAAVYNTITYTGSSEACGGVSSNAGSHGGAGTIYTFRATTSAGLLRIANCDVDGGITTLPSGTAINGDLIVERGAHLTSPAGAQTLALTTGALTIGATGSVTMSGRGAAGGTGPGAGDVDIFGGGGGGAFGGNGGDNASLPGSGGSTYGSPLSVVDAGSGGGASFYGAGGAGGGVLDLTVLGALTVNGTLTADGASGATDAGGGSGGSIRVTCSSLAGTGVISASGGSATNFGGSGGGGRISLTGSSSTFSGAARAWGGGGPRPGGAGSITSRLFAAPRPTVSFSNGGLAGATSDLPAASNWDANLVIDSMAVVSSPPAQILSLALAGFLTIQPLGALAVDGRGYQPWTGPGQGQAYPGFASGGGHGGAGGSGMQNGYLMAGGVTYDSPFAPVDFGSPGGYGGTGGHDGGAGGGAIALTVNGVCTVLGRLSADGAPGAGSVSSSSGGGAGGSVMATVGSLTGTGAISAAGGATAGTGGSGGGGRIALFVNTSTYSGTATACSPASTQTWFGGGAGTIYTKVASQPRGELLVDACNSTNDGRTELPAGTHTWTANVRLRNRGSLAATAGSPLHLEVTGNVTVDSLSSIMADARGSASGQGLGAGGANGTFGGGGGYGGAGAAAGGAPGGSTYGTAAIPVDLGSGGGASFYGIGGAGGGAVYLVVSDTLRLNGSINANGQGSASPFAGAGSGGSVYVNSAALAGVGTVTATGGDGGGLGGSGGGGRIHVTACTNAGALYTFSALGGSLSFPAGTGTIYPSGGIDWTCPQPTAVDDPAAAAPRVARLAVFASRAGTHDGALVTLALPSPTHARVDVLDMRGRWLATLADGVFTAGEHRMSWDGVTAGGDRIASGIHVVRVTTPQGTAAGRLLMLR